MDDLRIAPATAAPRGGLTAFLAREFRRLPYSVPLTETLYSERVLTKSLCAESVALAATVGSEVVGYLHGASRPAADGEGPDRSGAAVELLLFDDGEPRAGERLLDAALAEFRSRGARSAEAMTASGGYPFFRGLYCGAEPALPESLHHVETAFLDAGFRASSLALLSAELSAPRGSGGAPAGVTIESRPLPLVSLWARESWRGMSPRLEMATRGREKSLGRMVWTMLPGVRSRSGGAGAVGSIAELSVRADLRRQGIGRALIGRALEEMRAAGATEVLVTAAADSEAALGAYGSCGFKPALRMASFRRLIL